MTSSPKVSVIVTHYNYSRFLGACLDSIRKQTYTDYEIVLVDDGSDPEERERAVQLAGGVDKLILTKHCGTMRASNTGVKVADGEYCTLVNADDWIATDFLEKLVNALDQADPTTALAYSNFRHYADDKRFDLYIVFPDWNLRRLRRMNYVLCSALFRKSIFQAVGGFQDPDGMEDYGLWLSMALSGFKGVHVEEPLYAYRSHPVNRSNGIDIERSMQIIHQRLEIPSEVDDIQRAWTEYTMTKGLQNPVFGISVQLALKLFDIARQTKATKILEVGRSFATFSHAQALITQLKPVTIDIFDKVVSLIHDAWFRELDFPAQLHWIPKLEEADRDYDLIFVDIGMAESEQRYTAIREALKHLAPTGVMIVDDNHFLRVQDALMDIEKEYGSRVMVVPMMDTKDQHGRLAARVEWTKKPETIEATPIQPAGNPLSSGCGTLN